MSFSVPILKTNEFEATGTFDPKKKVISIQLSGCLSEAVKLHQVTAYVSSFEHDAKTLCIDVAEVSRISSQGIREWLQLIERVQKARLQIRFERVGEEFMEKVATFPDILGPRGTSVALFAAPYFCSKCKGREIQWLDPSKLDSKKVSLEPPAFNCMKCRSVMTFDELAKDYFAFLSRTR